MPIYDKEAFAAGLVCVGASLFHFAFLALLANTYELNIFAGCVLLVSIGIAVWGWFHDKKNYRYISETGYHIVIRGKDISFAWEQVLGVSISIIRGHKQIFFILNYNHLDRELEKKIKRNHFCNFSYKESTLREIGKFKYAGHLAN